MKPMRRRRISAVAALLLLVSAVSGCGTAATSTPTVVPTHRLVTAAQAKATSVVRAALAAMRRPVIGAPPSALDSAWTPNYVFGASDCNTASGQQLCEYKFGGHNITVGFGVEFPRGRAWDMISYGWRTPGSAQQWKFLLSLLPAGTHRTGCTTITKTGGGYGPARACVYRWYGHSILVAQYLHPSDPTTQGEVAMDAGYGWIAAAS
jgi:hypothetical protein